MTYRTILVHAEANPAHGLRLRTAANLADRFEAEVIGLGAETIPPFDRSMAVSEGLADDPWMAALNAQLAQNLSLAEANFRQAMGGRAHEWRTQREAPTAAMAATARGADLIVVGGTDKGALSDPCGAVDTGRLIMGSGRPVLHCPAMDDRLSLRTVMIAWRDTREARRAAADALPFLRAAGRVVIVEICAEAEIGSARARAADVAAWLGRQGVSAEVDPVVRNTAPAADQLLDTAEAHGAELIVAGAYGHSRLGEWVFGGVTETLLHQDRRFVLMSH